MSQSAPPPPPPPQPSDTNPYTPPVPAAPQNDNVALGLVAALGAALVAAALYGVVTGLTEHEIGWAAVGVGFVIGLAAGKVGGRNPALAVGSAVLALGAVYIGQLVGEAMIGADTVGVSFSELFFQHFGLVQEAWKQDADPLTFLFYALAAFAAFSGTKKAAA